MRIHAQIPVVMLLVTFGTVINTGRAEQLDVPDRGLIVAAHEALADVEELCVVVSTYENRQIDQLIDLAELSGQVVAKLEEAGIKHVECTAGLAPTLVIAIETMAVPDCGRYVYRVQTSLKRVVAFLHDTDRHVQAEVWRLRPVMKAAPKEGLSAAIAATVATQAEAFVGAYQAARRLRPRVGALGQDPPASGTVARRDLGGAAEVPAQALPFVASRNSSVFHKADCRWAQNITEHNRVRYRTREEALQDGKRPCKSCKP